ncbi:hypothetical protein [Pseudomonas sp. Snoq117.2]|uniref:hypothetical protein n=1 Tax=Pseudomonas sp. Snoq117.2 TaxID=1500302 RepID=UPI0008B160EB|nr:hypothetical protein [Pseudomonas sp. Snoq117.2]SEO42741.1 hypothetical protein SAMN02787149_10137 [Pseudomonas sp. Snoq117.2]
MKVRALASLSGAVGDREPGDEFDVKAEDGRQLIERGLVVEVDAKTTKPAPKAEEKA